MKFSVQLYSEFAGYHGCSAGELRAALDDAGMVADGCHMGLNDLRLENLPKTIEFCKTLGMDKIGIGGAPHATARMTAKSCTVLKKAHAAALPQGITIYYHNHSGEFKPFRNKVLAIDMFKAACALQVPWCARRRRSAWNGWCWRTRAAATRWRAWQKGPGG
jgi:hypothetical protein